MEQVNQEIAAAIIHHKREDRPRRGNERKILLGSHAKIGSPGRGKLPEGVTTSRITILVADQVIASRPGLGLGDGANPRCRRGIAGGETQVTQ